MKAKITEGNWEICIQPSVRHTVVVMYLKIYRVGSSYAHELFMGQAPDLVLCGVYEDGFINLDPLVPESFIGHELCFRPCNDECVNEILNQMDEA